MSSSLPVPAREFPGLDTGWHRRRPAYLDNACLTPTPRIVADAVAAYYERLPSCPLRSPTRQAHRMDLDVREARERVRKYLHAQFSDEIIFTPNCTMAVNLLALSFLDRPGAVLLSDAEHNSNRLPWLRQEVLELAWPPGQSFPMDEYRALLKRGVKLVSLVAESNVTGARIPVSEVVREAHALGIPVHLDAAQWVLSGEVDLEEQQPDFLSFSFHKLYGPSGLGALYATRQQQRLLEPLLAGGGTVDDHHDRDVAPTAGPARFEFGLQNFAAQAAVPACMDFLQRFTPEGIRGHFLRLNALARELLGAIVGLRFLDAGSAEAAGHIVTFEVDGQDPMHLAELLDQVGDIQVRAGHMCAHHLFHRYELPPAIRVSFGYQSTDEEVRRLARVLDSLLRHYVSRGPDAA